MTAATGPLAEGTVWVPTPPGWVEIAAFDSDDRAEAHWRDMVEPARDHLGDAAAAELYRVLRTARQATAGGGVTSAGIVLTLVDGELTVWTLTTTVQHVRSGELSPAALVERGVGGPAVSTEDVTFPGDRTGVLARFTTPAGDGGAPEQHHALVAVALPGRPHDLALVSGTSNRAEDAELLAMATVSMAAGVQIGAEPPPASTQLRRILRTVSDRTAEPAPADRP